MKPVFFLQSVVVALAGLCAPALASHHVFHITNNGSLRITALAMVFHLPDGTTVRQSYNVSIPLRVIKDISIPHSVVTSAGSTDTSSVCTIDLAITYSDKTSHWLMGADLCSSPNIDARDTAAYAYKYAEHATPIPDLTPPPTPAPATPRPSATPRTPAEEAFHRGQQYFDKGEFAAAIPFFSQAIKLSPRFQSAYAYRSQTYFLMGRFQQSLSDADAGLHIDITNSLLHYFRADTEWALGLNDSAVEDYNAASASHPEARAFITVLAVVAAREGGDQAQAKTLLAACLAGCKAAAETIQLLQYLQGTITARDLLNSAKNDSERTAAHALLGFSAALRGKTADVRQHFEWVVQHDDPTDLWRPIARARLAKLGISRGGRH
ncbi:MAG: hypothetical protein NVSMB31_01710 [Vulcanimicrobiaceae bacterium]